MTSAEEQEESKEQIAEYLKKHAKKELVRVQELYKAGVSPQSPEMLEAMVPLFKMYDSIVGAGYPTPPPPTWFSNSAPSGPTPMVATAKDFGLTHHIKPRRAKKHINEKQKQKRT